MPPVEEHAMSRSNILRARPGRATVSASAAVGLLALLALGAARAAEPALEQGRHAEIPHAHDAETVQKLRDAVPVYRGLTDEEIHQGMMFMRADYAWYISHKDVRGDVGVLMLSHGVSETSDRQFKAALAPVAARYPTAIGYGMAMTSSEALQQAVDDINARGVKLIVAVDPESSEHKSLYRQWQYIVGARDKAAYVAVPQVKSKAPIVMAPPINNDPLVARILLDNARGISKDPRREAVIVIAHGPEDDVDNPPDLAEVQKLAQWVGKEGGFARTAALNIQDDAPKEKRAANVQTFRRMVTDAQAAGLEVLVVPYAINVKGIQPKLQKDLEGLTFRFADKGISEHPNFVEWVVKTVRESAAKKS
jgi:sirohydrochlorin cobaltochelatase